MVCKRKEFYDFVLEVAMSGRATNPNRYPPIQADVKHESGSKPNVQGVAMPGGVTNPNSYPPIQADVKYESGSKPNVQVTKKVEVSNVQVTKHYENYSGTSTPESKSLLCCKIKSSKKIPSVKFSEPALYQGSTLSETDFDYENISTFSTNSVESKKMCSCSSIKSGRKCTKECNLFTALVEMFMSSLKTFISLCVQVVKDGYNGVYPRTGNFNDCVLTTNVWFCAFMSALYVVGQLLLLIMKMVMLCVDTVFLFLHLVTGVYCDSRNWLNNANKTCSNKAAAKMEIIKPNI